MLGSLCLLECMNTGMKAHDLLFKRHTYKLPTKAARLSPATSRRSSDHVLLQAYIMPPVKYPQALFLSEEASLYLVSEKVKIEKPVPSNAEQ